MPRIDKRAVAEGLKQGLLFGAATLALLLPPGGVATQRAAPTPPGSVVPASVPFAFTLAADFGSAPTSAATRALAEWVFRSGDPGGLPFAVLDKRDARLHVFQPDGRHAGSTPVLLGSAEGDDTVPGIGSRPIDEVRPEERTTPAGRFVSQPGLNALGEQVVWVDYGAAVSMHPVRVVEKRERRLERLATPTPDDNRISYGCINVPADFFAAVVRPVLGEGRAVVYVLPETRPLNEVFALARE